MNFLNTVSYSPSSTTPYPEDYSKFSILGNCRKENFSFVSPSLTNVTYESPKNTESQIREFFSLFPNKINISNEDQIVEYLLTQSNDVDTIIEPFLFINKIIANVFSDTVKIFIQKYDDPETKDHFISAEIQQKAYPDDFIDKIWDVRDKFSEEFPDNDWLLITTNFKPLRE
jgi:hypothetical protein